MLGIPRTVLLMATLEKVIQGHLKQDEWTVMNFIMTFWRVLKKHYLHR